MTKLHLNQEVVVFTTPKELRKIADLMEDLWATSLPGDSLEAFVWAGPGLAVSVCCEQDQMQKQYPRRARARAEVGG